MALKAIHDKLEDIPEQYQDLYTEKNGKFELTGIAGVKTQADVDRVQDSLRRQTDLHKETKQKLHVWDGMEIDDVRSKLDRIPELELASKNKLDEAAIDEIANRRSEAMTKSKMAPVEHENKELKRLNAEKDEKIGKFETKERTDRVHTKVREALIASKVLPDAQEDALLLADRHFEITEDGHVQTRDGSGVIAGLDPVGWLTELQEKRRHWWPESVGGGSRGSGGGGGSIGKNPWSNEHWDMGAQGRIYKEHGRERCEQLAKAAGTKFGGLKPAPKK